jgi:anti-sigma regulatory factor (Ser/Thr protein kinase)
MRGLADRKERRGLMPYYACPNCGSSVSSAAGPAPAACPGCCAKLHPAEDVPAAVALSARRERPPAPALRVPIGAGTHAPAAARRALRELRPELGDARLRTCELLVSELVTNVLRHAPASDGLGPADMRVRLYGDRVRVEVRDGGPGFSPRARTPDQGPAGGWGLHLVDEMSDQWGVEPGLQNCVWFELGRTPLASGVHAAAH